MNNLKQRVVTSPALTLVRDKWFDVGGWQLYGCVEVTSRFVEIPKARKYWFQWARTQWSDNSGTALTVAACLRWIDSDGGYQPMYLNMRANIRKLGLSFRKPRTIWWRLLYQE